MCVSQIMKYMQIPQIDRNNLHFIHLISSSRNDNLRDCLPKKTVVFKI